MHPVTPQNVHAIIARAQRRSFLTNPFYLIAHCQFEDRDGDTVVYVDRDTLIFPCARPEHMAHWKVWCFASEVARIGQRLTILDERPDAIEYFYTTSHLIDLSGPRFKNMRNRIGSFTRRHVFTLHHDFPTERTRAFLDVWFAQRRGGKTGSLLVTLESEYKSTRDALDILPQIGGSRALYVTVGEALVGFTIYVPLHPDFWVSVFQKVDSRYAGLSMFLYHTKCKEMSMYRTFSNGDDAMDPALAAFKRGLRPTATEQHTLLTLGGVREPS